MKDLTITVECLQDLAAFHMERVAGYLAMKDVITPSETHLGTLFDAFIRQSKMMGEELRKVGAAWGWNGEPRHDDGTYGLAWSVVKAVFSSKMIYYPIEKCRSGENALLIAYHNIEGTAGLPEPVRLLINRQKREVISAREWISHFETLQLPLPGPAQPQLAFS